MNEGFQISKGSCVVWLVFLLSFFFLFVLPETALGCGVWWFGFFLIHRIFSGKR